jgi:predicted metal-binding membrane protein
MATGAFVRRERTAEAGLVALLVAFAAFAWLAVDRRMDGMDGMDMGLGSLGAYTGAWALMMAAMMFPSISPTVALYDRLRRGHGVPAVATAGFVAGYLATWTAFGVLAYAVARIAGRPAWDGAGHVLAGIVVLGATAYQLTPLKERCLTRCRGGLMWLLERWRAGLLGALRLGATHGAWCVGCCWALMAALFVLGLMSLGWMAFVAALIAAEKLAPSPRAARLVVAAVLAVLGTALLAVL